MSIFYQFGDITSVRVLRPGKEIPHDLRDGLGKLILTDIAAVVEFETTESAANAFHRFSINNEIAFDNVPYELNVSLMGTGMEEELDSGKSISDPTWIKLTHSLNPTLSRDRMILVHASLIDPDNQTKKPIKCP